MLLIKHPRVITPPRDIEIPISKEVIMCTSAQQIEEIEGTHCTVCGRELNPIEAAISDICHTCARRGHHEVTGKRRKRWDLKDRDIPEGAFAP